MISAGRIVSTESTIEASMMSRSDLRSRMTTRLSQRTSTGVSASDSERARRTSSTSPVQTWLSRSSSTAIMGSLSPAIGSRSQTMPRLGSAEMNRPAEPSLNISTIGGVLCIRTR